MSTTGGGGAPGLRGGGIDGDKGVGNLWLKWATSLQPERWAGIVMGGGGGGVMADVGEGSEEYR